MAFDFSKGESLPPELARSREKKGLLERAGGFLAPTTTGLLTGDKKLSGKTALGAAFEVGSFMIPAGAIARGFRLAKSAATGVKVLKAAKTAKTATKPLTGISRLKGLAKTGSQVGGVSGGMFMAGGELGEEDSTFGSVLREGALGTVTGAAGGAILTPGLSVLARGSKYVAGSTAKNIRQLLPGINPKVRKTAVDDLTKALHSSFVADKGAVLTKLEKIVRQSARKGTNLNEMDLLREVAEQGYMPTVDGEIGRFVDSIADVKVRQGKLADGVRLLAAKAKGRGTFAQLSTRADEILIGRTDLDYAKATKQLKAVVNNLKKKYGTSLNGTKVNEIRETMNKTGKKIALGADFVQDVQNALATASREMLDALDPNIRKLNAQSAKLFRVRNTMQAINNKKIATSFLTDSFGRFMGTVGGAAGLATLGAGGGVFGAGGLVIAGVLAQLGSKSVAGLIRRSRFNPAILKLIKTTLKGDQKLLNKLIGKATPADKALLQRLAGKKTTPIQIKPKPIARKIKTTK